MIWVNLIQGHALSEGAQNKCSIIYEVLWDELPNERISFQRLGQRKSVNIGIKNGLFVDVRRCTKGLVDHFLVAEEWFACCAEAGTSQFNGFSHYVSISP